MKKIKNFEWELTSLCYFQHKISDHWSLMMVINNLHNATVDGVIFCVSLHCQIKVGGPVMKTNSKLSDDSKLQVQKLRIHGVDSRR